MTYREALDALGRCRRLGMKLGLEKMEALAAALGRPQDRLRFIHIAGTNGKGSTAAFCDAALRRRGLKTGLFTSPHLATVRERIRIDGVPISRDDFASGLSEVLAAAQGLPEALREPTFFELLTALALLHFANNGVAWAVWETGLGGRLDSTNLVTPAVSVITNIAADHQEFLGPDLPSIAREKAGILKPGIPAVTAVTAPEALEVIRSVAAEKKARLQEIDQSSPVVDLGPEAGRQHVRIAGHDYRLSLLGAHQARNAACAAAALGLLDLQPPFSHEELAAAFGQIDWPGRFQPLRWNPPLIIDGGHNPDGIAAAVAAWKALCGNRTCHLVYGTLGDKDAATAVRLLTPIAHRVSLVAPASDRALDPSLLAPRFAPLPTTCHPSLAALWPGLESSAEPVLVIGSLVLAGDALRLAGKTEDEEAQLNELLSPSPPSRAHP